jgi:hypothetical protein
VSDATQKTLREKLTRTGFSKKNHGRPATILFENRVTHPLPAMLVTQ